MIRIARRHGLPIVEKPLFLLFKNPDGSSWIFHSPERRQSSGFYNKTRVLRLDFRLYLAVCVPLFERVGVVITEL